MSIPQRKGDPLVVEHDEGVRPGTTVESLGALRPAFSTDGTVTAGNASQLSDGASAVVVMSPAEAERRGVTPLGEIVAYGMVAGPDSVSLLHQPSGAINAALARAGLSVGDVDLFEINEAFAAVGIASMADLGITEAVINVNGGAIALGHPIGMSGNRLALTRCTSCAAVAAARPPWRCAAAAARATPSSSRRWRNDHLRLTAAFWARSLPIRHLGAYNPGSGAVRAQIHAEEFGAVPFRSR